MTDQQIKCNHIFFKEKYLRKNWFQMYFKSRKRKCRYLYFLRNWISNGDFWTRTMKAGVPPITLNLGSFNTSSNEDCLSTATCQNKIAPSIYLTIQNQIKPCENVLNPDMIFRIKSDWFLPVLDLRTRSVCPRSRCSFDEGRTCCPSPRVGARSRRRTLQPECEVKFQQI